VHIPSWQTQTSFDVVGLRPARASFLQATTGAAVLSVPVWVKGLALSEIYYRPLSGPLGFQWVELANLGSLPIALGGYSLGAGGASFGVTRIPLGSGMLPPGGCLVVGGPNGLPANLVPMVAHRISPVLGLGALPAADGLALFDLPGDVTVGSDAVPLDAVVWAGQGVPNANRLPSADGRVALPVDSVAAGQSLARGRDGAWSATTSPTPGTCVVSHVP
jgi:hypothetical protein